MRHMRFDVATAPLEGMSLIEASAGTGKTYAIAGLYLRFVMESGLAPESILAVTFTKAATSELSGRIRRRLSEALAFCSGKHEGDDPVLSKLVRQAIDLCGETTVRKRLAKAISSFDQAAIFTIHGFCERMLSERSFECGEPFDAELAADSGPLVSEILSDFYRRCSVSALQCAALEFSGLMPRRDAFKFISQLLSSLRMRLEPPERQCSLDELQKSLDMAMGIWRISRDEIKSVLHGASKILSKDRKDGYSEDRIESIFSAMDMAAEGEPSKSSFDAVGSLAAGRIKTLRKSPEPKHEFFDAAAKFMSSLEGYSISVKLELAEWLRTELEARKLAQNVMHFDDLLSKMCEGLKGKDGGQLGASIRDRYKAAMIDEFQDTDPVQLEIFTKAFSHHGSTLMFIGDPKQSIYKFRGADVFSYMEAARRTPSERSFSLDENWRSAAGLVDAMNKMFGNCPDSFALGDGLRYIEVKAAPNSKGSKEPLLIDGSPPAPMRISLFPETRKLKDCIEWAAAMAKSLLKLSAEGRATIGGRPLKPSDIAMLVLKNGDAELLRDRLSKFDIPAALQKSGDVMKTPEAKETLRVLEAILSSSDQRRMNAALITRVMGVSPEHLCRMLEDPSSQDEYDAFLESFRRRRQEWTQDGFIAMFRRMLIQCHTGGRMMSAQGGERAFTNILHIAEIMQRQAETCKLGPERLTAWLADRISDDATAPEEHELRLERDDDAVAISTVHKSKGLEYPVVLCPTLWQRNAMLSAKEPFKYHNKSGELVMDIGGEGREGEPLAAAREEELSDLLRLLYVALTRARSLCAFAWGKMPNAGVSAPAHLLHNKSRHGEYSVEGFASQFTKMTALEISNELSCLQSESLLVEDAESHVFKLLDSSPRANDSNADGTLRHREFSGRIRRDIGMSSFSRISARNDDDFKPGAAPADFILQSPFDMPKDSLSAGYSRPSGIFAFPKGPVAGSCLHSIFERLDFSAPQNDMRNAARRAIQDFSLGGASEEILEERVSAVEGMLEDVLGAPLIRSLPDFRLRDIPRDSRSSELEFHMPCPKISPDWLERLFTEHLPEGVGKSFPKSLGSLSFDEMEGFMHGYIDLAFEAGGVHWLADWKSNHLGDSIEDYNPQRLQEDMESSLYILQSCIYAAAWAAHLKTRLPSFDYSKKFGGVLYIYLRGVSKGRPFWGVHTVKPPEPLVAALSGRVMP